MPPWVCLMIIPPSTKKKKEKKEKEIHDKACIWSVGSS